jgi:hypothetical protein
MLRGSRVRVATVSLNEQEAVTPDRNKDHSSSFVPMIPTRLPEHRQPVLTPHHRM